MSMGHMIPRNHWRVGPRAQAGSRRAVDRLFDELWHGFQHPRSAFVAEAAGRFVPQLDVSENDDEYRVSAELPGVEEGSFEVLLEDGVLTVKGEKKQAERREGENVRRLERASGKFSRTIRFPVPVDEDKVTASYKNGVLEVVLPKPEEEKPKLRNIPIETR